MKEADMLESHIIQARARAAATESQAYERMKERMGDVYDHQGLLTGGMETLSWMNMTCYTALKCCIILLKYAAWLLNVIYYDEL